MALIARETRRLRCPTRSLIKPKREIHGISPTTASLETVAATWAFLQHIEASNEIVTTIYDGKEQFLDKN